MNRYLPVARQHFLAALASTSVVVKAISAVVVLLYLLSWAVDTPYALGVTPGYLFPPNFWVWTLATHGVVERHVWGVAANVGTVMACGRLLEPLWGALELLIFFAVVNVSAGLLAGLSYLLTYVSTFDLDFLFAVRVHGAAGFLGGVLVALKQTMGDTTVLRVPQVRLKAAPALVLLFLALLRLSGLLDNSAPLAAFSYGALSGWVYLRFYQRHSRGRGDMSDHFAFASFFPEALQPVVGLLAGLVHSALVKVKVCRKMVKRYDVGAPSSITISLPGTDPQDAERRRQLALKALNERLKRVEDQSAWPSMDDEEDDEEDEPEDLSAPPPPHPQCYRAAERHQRAERSTLSPASSASRMHLLDRNKQNARDQKRRPLCWVSLAGRQFTRFIVLTAAPSQRSWCPTPVRMAAIRKKLVIVGDGACGKTCLLIVFSKDQFPEVYVPTVFENYVADIEVDGKQVELALWDTAGQEDYDRLRPLSYPDTDVILMCFSIDSPDSLENIPEKWTPEVKHFCPNVPIILVGNKKDLRNDEHTRRELAKMKQEPVKSEEGRDMAGRIAAFGYMECSAKTKDGVREVFEMATRAALQARRGKKSNKCVLL
ncbi:hypothetical protein F2P81_012107 [Scophthalmus maximus]|uniref:Transmembrane protein 115 n=8 Tax=Percomorphaceae TaxID=1489872 RepID=A0A6A4SVR4_SCOMX|nr:hypothetical protein F2P81_012107 [Scophthalmus maximus]